MVLIVCEGERTEPNYFRAMVDDLQLNTANIVVAKNTAGSSPKTIVEFALKEYGKEKEYDRIYCISCLLILSLHERLYCRPT
jgi:hypothetical protein